MLNDVTIMGRLTASPELRTTSSDTDIARFCVAVERSYKAAGEERKTDFIDCVAFDKSAQFLCRWFRKGQMIAVQGELQQSRWQDDSGNNRSKLEVKADRLHFCGDKPEDRETEAVSGETPYAVQRVEQMRAEGKLPAQEPYAFEERQVDLSGPAFTPEEDLPF